jgi:hypothetical protein
MSQVLIKQIEKAFASVAYFGDNDLTSSIYRDEPEALKRAFRGKDDWRTIDANFLDQAPEGWSSALSFFSDLAFKFYLPAYLIADLRGDLTNASPEFSLCYGVTPQSEGKKIAKIWGGVTVGDYKRQRFALFNSEQVSAISNYLRWKVLESEDVDIVQALENYWLEREAGGK